MDLVDETEEQTERVRKTKTKTIGVCLAAGPILDAIGLFILPLRVRSTGHWEMANGHIIIYCVQFFFKGVFGRWVMLSRGGFGTVWQRVLLYNIIT